jgi:antitoxin component YwqK of YwqJK toxin-antitoxin module
MPILWNMFMPISCRPALLLAALLLTATVGCSGTAPSRPSADAETPGEDEPAKKGLFSAATRVEIETEHYVQGGKKSERVVRKGADGEPIPHGRFTSWHSNGKIWLDGTNFNGLKSGVWTEQNEEGQMVSQGSYREGLKDGRWVTFPEPKIRKEEDYRDGELRGERFFTQDDSGAYTVRVGTWREWHEPAGRTVVEQAGTKDQGKTPRSQPAQLKSEKRFVNGLEDGVWQVWNAAGQVLETRSYKLGQPDGVWKESHGADRLKSLREFRDGKPHGRMTVYFENGQVEEQGDYVDGERHGAWTSWLLNGQKTKEENYERGKLQGKITEWYLGQQIWYEGQYDQGQKTGEWVTLYKAEGGKPQQKRSVERYLAGKPEGVWEYWFPNGQLERHEEYAGGRPSGKWKAFYENGQQLAETDFKDGLPDGIHTRWTPDGKKEAVEVYEKGMLVNVQPGEKR